MSDETAARPRAGGAPALGKDDLEDLSRARLDGESQRDLLAAQTECTFVFRGSDGAPTGTVLSFAHHEGSLWFTSVRGRVHVRAIERDPEVSVVVSSTGSGLPGRRMLSLRGVASVHADAEAMAPVLGVLAARLAPGGEDAFIALLSSPNRIVIEVRPTRVVISHDSRKIHGNGRGGD